MSTAPWATVHAARVSKRGHTAAECEDAVAWSFEDETVRIAVADGATESAHARVWAQMLAETLVEKGTTFNNGVPKAQADFRERVASDLATVPWYVAQKQAQGAHAAVLALHVSADGTWRAHAVGDVGLFHLRGQRLLSSWPIADASAFTTRPELVSSQEPSHDGPDTEEGRWAAGDVLLVATDALAAALLRDLELLTQFAESNADVWERLIEQAHARGMTNDDVALVRVVLSNANR